MRVTLKTGAYTARSVIANCQRCVNLYAEENPEDAPVPFTYYPTPGLVLIGPPPVAGAGRGLYRASNGVLYAVAGQTLYSISASFVWTAIGTLVGIATTPVSMVDNQTTLFVVDGSANGYTITLATGAFSTVSNAAFYGADAVAFADTYFVFNKPNTGEFYISNSNAVTFNPLYFATKIGFSDLLATVAVVHREIWLIGEMTTEIWVNSGATDFPYEIMNGAFVQHGCAAKHSVAQMGDALFWLCQDLQGQNVVVKGQGYQTQRVSTHSIETALASYATISDAVGFAYQQEGHQFYVLTFPTADKTWCFDLATGQWHERVWTDSQGGEHRHRAVAHAFAYGVNIVQDWQTGTLYRLDLDTYNDAGAPIVRRRSFPHMGQDGKRVFYTQFIADMEVGRVAGVALDPVAPLAVGVDGSPLTGAGVDGAVAFIGVDNGATPLALNKLYLRYSDTRGERWSNPIDDELGATGEFLKSIQFQRLGMARDRVFELFWSCDARTALNGAFIEVAASKS